MTNNPPTGRKRTAAAWLLAAMAMAACARQGYPPGGPKDEQPPAVVATSPHNESRNFDERSFYVQFDEYVVLKNAAENVLVSPPMKHKPDYSTKGRGVLVTIKDTLQPNTTYLFQFKEAIADFTEGNLLASYEYVFSTGDAMDTMALRGVVTDARSGKPWKETVTVMAYGAESADTAACDSQPLYTTRCDKEGRFAFHYIRPGRYRLVAVEDKNGDLRAGVAEATAWDSTAHAAHGPADSAAAGASLRLSTPDNSSQRVVKSEFAEAGRIVIACQLPLRQPTVEGTETVWRLNEGRDTLTAWCLDATADTALIVLRDDGLDDTLRLRRPPQRGGRRRAAAQPAATPLARPLCAGTAAYYDDLRIAFTNPVAASADSLRAVLTAKKDSTVTLAPIVLDSTGLTARIEATVRSGESYHVRIAPGLFTDIYGTVSDSLSFDMTPKDFGTLSLDIANRTGMPMVIEVLDKRDTVVQRQAMTAAGGRVRFTHLPAGDYRLRAVLDADSNGRWTPGDYRRQRQPEQWQMFGKTLSLREKWEMEEKWTVTGTPTAAARLIERSLPGTLPRKQ